MVMGAHRGHGLGLVLKSAVLGDPGRRAPRASARAHLERRHQRADAADQPASLGFRPVELMMEMQRKDADA